MRQATLFNYNILLEAGTVLRDRRIKSRQGLLVRLKENGREGWGEIAPLPGFSRETLPEVQSEAARWLQNWQADPATQTLPTLPSVAFGLSCALAELADVLPAEGNFNSATLCTGDPDELLQQLGRQEKPTAKMKVGLYEAARDGMLVTLLLEAVPELTLRLDANRQWSLAKARQFASFVPEHLRSRIAFIEEPCRTQQESRLFIQETAMALAWDESTREVDFQPMAEPHLRAIVIKPMLLGSLTKVGLLVSQAKKAGLTVVISSSLESSLGLTQLARLANWLTPGVVPGLDTLSLMQQQLVRAWPGSTLPLVAADNLDSVWPH
ncbi:o-succinylbenzoate synthase [Erwinia phyllosphaerae]|uniref:o-succinylbenzoate synthase n=1 Tax=Erwinia phyllosphaerae TaxID=2853256 RepID=UPI001FED6116|nr:o-succinylbenzoate synthase [Erwinia phyllosphaerae]MBV4365534.1 o-succinylbenzoate synthase [Erwinia phyllosphaerae]